MTPPIQRLHIDWGFSFIKYSTAFWEKVCGHTMAKAVDLRACTHPCLVKYSPSDIYWWFST